MVFKAYIDSKNKRILVTKKDYDLHEIPLSLIFEYQKYFCLPIVEE